MFGVHCMCLEEDTSFDIWNKKIEKITSPWNCSCNIFVQFNPVENTVVLTTFAAIPWFCMCHNVTKLICQPFLSLGCVFGVFLPLVCSYFNLTCSDLLQKLLIKQEECFLSSTSFRYVFIIFCAKLMKLYRLPFILEVDILSQIKLQTQTVP